MPTKHDNNMSDSFHEQAYRRIRQAVTTSSTPLNTSATSSHAPTLPSAQAIAHARTSLPDPSKPNFLIPHGQEETLSHILRDLTPALTGQNLSGRYYGFVTGSTLPIAEVADNIVSAYDQNLSVHLPEQTIGTEVEDAALGMVLGLLGLGDGRVWQGRTLTTGATASNVLGMGCGREFVVRKAAEGNGVAGGEGSIGEVGFLRACMNAGVTDVRILTSMGHSSLSKAAGIVGLGRGSVKEMALSKGEPWRLDIDAVERELIKARDERVVNIIAVSAGEVNTSFFATKGVEDMRRLRRLADEHGAWIHVDGAFAIFSRALPKTPEFAHLHELAAGIELADCITVDGHKVLNVPYDCGMFFTRHSDILQEVCKNPNAAYLASSRSSGPELLSPLNIGIENSRRFRALPVYAALMSEGRDGVAEMVSRMVRLSRKVAAIIHELEDYELLPGDGEAMQARKAGEEDVTTGFVVLFRAKDEELNKVLVKKIHESREWYVSGTAWGGRPACRIAVSSWKVNVDEDARFIQEQLKKIAREHRSQ